MVPPPLRTDARPFCVALQTRWDSFVQRAIRPKLQPVVQFLTLVFSQASTLVLAVYAMQEQSQVSCIMSTYDVDKFTTALGTCTRPEKVAFLALFLHPDHISRSCPCQCLCLFLWFLDLLATNGVALSLSRPPALPPSAVAQDVMPRCRGCLTRGQPSSVELQMAAKCLVLLTSDQRVQSDAVRNAICGLILVLHPKVSFRRLDLPISSSPSGNVAVIGESSTAP